MATIPSKTLASNIINKFNVGSNDNKAFSGWSMKLWTTRQVLGASESRKILTEIKKLPAAKQKAVLSAIASRIAQGSTVGGLYVTPDAQPQFKRLADALGLHKSFVGTARPPMVMG